MGRWLLYGGTVLDGLGGESAADVVLEGGRIAAILPRGDGVDPAAFAGRVLDCRGLFVAPGFVDAHTHDDTAVFDPTWYVAKIRQGITTSAVGLDGFGCAPLPPEAWAAYVRYWRPVNGDPGHRLYPRLREYLREVDGQAGLHVFCFAPHANLRLAVAGFALRPLAAEEHAAMASALDVALADGAAGLSTGLTYVPAAAADEAELLALCRRLAAGGRARPYVTHLRAYGEGVFGAVDEALRLGRAAGVPVHLSHLHLSARAVWGQADRLLARLEAALAEGVDVAWDLYPYQAGSSVLYQYLPAAWQDGGPDAFAARLAEPGAAQALAADPGFRAFPWAETVVSHTASGRHVGQTIAALAAERRVPVAEAVVDLLLQEALDVGVVVHQTLEEDDDLLLLHPRAVVGSDGIFVPGRPHPRGWGAVARFWRRFVVERKALSPGEAVRRLSGAAAERFGLADRGRLRPGAAADVVAFDGAAFRDLATYEEPCRGAEGVRHVFVAGEPVLLDGVFDPAVRAGRGLVPR